MIPPQSSRPAEQTSLAAAGSILGNGLVEQLGEVGDDNVTAVTPQLVRVVMMVDADSKAEVAAATRLDPGQAPDSSSVLLRRGRRLEWFTLGWNVVGVVVLAFLAVTASSVALAGFGLNSFIEIGASMVVLWELSGRARRVKSGR